MDRFPHDQPRPRIADHVGGAVDRVNAAGGNTHRRVATHDRAADLDLANSMIFEVAPPRQFEMQGIADFVDKSSRDHRRKLVMNFWQD